MENKNKQPEQQPQNSKKKFNGTLFVQILSIVIFAACFAYMIYQVVAFDEADMWLPIICLVIAVMVAMSFFKETFVFSPKAFRNRMFLYVGTFAVLAIPNLVGNIVLCYSGRYVNDTMYMGLVNSHGTVTGALTVTILAELMTFAFLALILLLIIEVAIRKSAVRIDNE